MYKETEMTWKGKFPYDVLAPAGITPFSSIFDIQRSIMYFMRRGDAGEAHRSRSFLKQVNTRLFFDFFFYRRAMPGMEEFGLCNKEKH
jgi:hypothetical protein